MVQVKGTKGNIVKFQLLGVAKVKRRLNRIGRDIKDGEDAGVFRGAVFYEEEVKLSIAGILVTNR